MLVLIGCEESQTVCQAFLKAGHDTWSCDLQATRGDPSRHMQCDVLEAVSSRMWDLIILHPDCTKMAVSGNRWYGVGMPHHSERLASIEWTKGLWALAKKHAKRAALENPVSVIFSHISEPVQYVQPWMFGHGETKRTGFALHNLPELMPTNIVEGREQRVWKMPPSPTRKRDRSKTYQGIADAMASQWGAL